MVKIYNIPTVIITAMVVQVQEWSIYLEPWLYLELDHCRQWCITVMVVHYSNGSALQKWSMYWEPWLYLELDHYCNVLAILGVGSLQ
jgi:hypothetical protein